MEDELYRPIFSKLSRSVPMTAEERSALRALPIQPRLFPRRTEILRQGESPSQSCVLVRGHLCRRKQLPNGRRQILSFHFPGDIPDLQCLHLPELDHSLHSLEESLVGFIPHKSILQVMREFPRIADALWRQMLLDACIFREWIANMGGRAGYERIAHLLCEQTIRSQALGIDGRYPLFFNQQDLAEASGMSPVQVNRIIQSLKSDGLFSTEGQFYQTPDWNGLLRAAEFDAAYLNLETPRTPERNA